jgi:hypothetical protein
MTIKLKNFGVLLVLLVSIQFAFWFGIKIPTSTEANTDGTKKISYFWSGTKSEKPNMYVVPPVPSEEILRAFSLGDEQLYFRYNAYIIQFAGDTFGRTTALKSYDYAKLYDWWTILDKLDNDSDYQPFMVSYYYGATQTPENQSNYVVDFLEHHADKNPEKKWWWYSQAAYHARFKLKDDKRAMQIAEKLYNLPKDLDIPIWTRQLKAFLFEKEGEYKQSCDIIIKVLDDYNDGKLTEGEINFIYYFIQERIRKMIEKETTIAKADISPECRALMVAERQMSKKE